MERDSQMTPLDPISARMFPTLAAYARKVRRRELLAMAGITLSAYVLGRDVLRAYREGIATENMLSMVTRVNEIEEQCQRERPKRLIMTKAQAQISAQKREDARTMKIIPSAVSSLSIDSDQSKIGGLKERRE